MLVQARETGQSQTRQLRVTIHSDRERLLRMLVSPLEGGGSGTLLLVVRDLTDLYHLDLPGTGRKKYDTLVGGSRAMQEVYLHIEELASSNTRVLITGESGTGKELVARAIHEHSPLAGGPFVTVNCAALPEPLLESEMFGFVRNAFTGALKDRMGRFEEAHNGTLFLDEIGDMSLTMQAKLLRALNNGEFSRVGENRVRVSNARIIAATNRNLEEALAKGAFREDLYYRLKVASIELPALRERREDIPLLVEHFLEIFNRKFRKNIQRVDEDVLELFNRYPWPGNVRELRHALEQACVIAQDSVLTPAHFRGLQGNSEKVGPENQREQATGYSPPQSPERARFLKVLEETGWNVTEASRRMGISRNTFYVKMKTLGIRRPGR